MRFLKARPPNLCRPLAAFSIVEVLVGAMIVGVLFVSVYSGISHSFLVIQRSRENLRATQILSEKLELIRLYTWTQITAPGVVPTQFTNEFYPVGAYAGAGGIKYTGTVAFVSPAANSYYFQPGYCNYTGAIRKAVVTLRWSSAGSAGKLQTRTMETLVSSNGLQKYLY
jgi:type II secretory pathway pseudopilin PulG